MKRATEPTVLRRFMWLPSACLMLACSSSDATTSGSDVASVASAGSGGASSGGGGAHVGGSSAAQGGAGGADASSGGGGAAMVPLDGFGDLSGDCGELDPEELMAGAAPFELSNEIDFGSLRFDYDGLSPGAQTIHDDPNAGGSSKMSELFAFEVLHRCELAGLLKTETEIVYDAEGSITDLLVEIDGLKVGVSVVRAFKFMGDYTVDDALPKMTEKLADILESSDNVSSVDAWGKQILHVIAEKPANVTAVQEALLQIDADTRADTIVVVTLTSGADAFLY